MPLFIVRAMGAKQVATKFERMGIAAVTARPAMETIADMMMRIIGIIFESQGRRGGGSWRRDSVEWLMRKQRLNLDPRIGHATGALRRSMSIRAAEHQILHVDDKMVNLSSDLPYAATQQRNRPFVKFTQRDRYAMRSVVRDYLIGAFRA